MTALQTFTGDLKNLLRNPSMAGKYCVLYMRRAEAAVQRWRYRKNPEKIVQMGYDDMAGNYGTWALKHGRPDREKYTDLLKQKLPKGATLLELGCGPGIPTTKALAEHFQVTANDISESCLALAKQNAPSARFVHADMTTLSFPANSFDAVVAFYAFHHVPRDRYAPLLANIARWLKPGGVFMAALYPYDVENLVTENWHGATMYWSSFDRERTEALVRDAGFKIETASLESAVEEGKETTFLWVLTTKC